jgi:hypothetical protein
VVQVLRAAAAFVPAVADRQRWEGGKSNFRSIADMVTSMLP